MVDVVECFARKALQSHVRDDKPPAHALLSVRRSTDDDVFDPSQAARIYAEHMARFDT